MNTSKMFGYSLSNFMVIEDDLMTFCKNNEINILIFKKKNYVEIAKIMGFNTNPYWEHHFKLDLLKKVGCCGRPDYFLYKLITPLRMEFWFVEYKSFTDYLHPSQIKWFKKYRKFPLIVMYSLIKGKTEIKDYKIDKKSINNEILGVYP